MRRETGISLYDRPTAEFAVFRRFKRLNSRSFQASMLETYLNQSKPVLTGSLPLGVYSPGSGIFPNLKIMATIAAIPIG